MANPATDLANFISQMGPAFVNQRESVTSKIDPSALALSDEAFAVAIRQAGSTQDALVQNILKRAALSFSSELPASHVAGVYNDTVTAQMANEAMARATGEAADAVLKAQTAGLGTAGSISNQRVASGRGTASVKGPGLGSKAGTIATSALLGQLARKGITKVSDLFKTAPETTDMPEQLAGPGFQGAAATEDATSVIDSSAMTDAAFGDIGASASSLIQDAGASTDSLAGVQAGDEGFASIVGTSTEEQAAAAAALGMDVTGIETATSAGVGAEAGAAAGAEGAAAAGAGAEGAAAAGEAGAAASEGAGLGEAAVEGAALWVVCTELNRQHRLPNKYYIPGAKVFMQYDEFGKKGYYYWAIPLATHVRKYPNSLLSKAASFVMNRRAEQIAGKKSVAGFIFLHSLYWICWILARTLAKDVQIPTRVVAHG